MHIVFHNERESRLAIVFQPHALERMEERGATREEVGETIEFGEIRPAKQGRSVFSKVISRAPGEIVRDSDKKLIEVYAVPEGEDMIVVTVIVKYFSGEF
jgi:hypothetical protein